MNPYQKACCVFLAAVILGMVGIGGFVGYVDPFFHYHTPQPTLQEKYRIDVEDTVPLDIGMVKNFDYDSMVVGSSMVHNLMLSDLEQQFGGKFVKIADYHQFDFDMETVALGMKRHKVNRVLVNLDYFTIVRFPGGKSTLPRYLADDNPLNDYRYLFSIDVVNKALQTATRREVQNWDPFQWATNESAGKEGILSRYSGSLEPLPLELPQMEHEDYTAAALENIDLLMALVKDHPETEFLLYYPPYSMLDWRLEMEAGKLNAYQKALSLFAEELLPFENVKVYYFSDMEETFDLNNYVDTTHPIPKVLSRMVEQFGSEENRIFQVEQLVERQNRLREKVCAVAVQ